MIGIRSFLHRHRHRIALAAVLSALCVALAVEHSGLGQEHMGEAISMCLAVVEGGALLAAAGLGLSKPRLPRPARRTGPASLQPVPSAPVSVAPLPRAGPSLLQVFLS
jgi:hypothetical protein